MSKMGAEERAERRNRQTELAEELKATGALDEVFARIDAGEPLTGDGGVLGGMLKAALERGLEAERSEHVGYEKSAPDAVDHPNSRNGHYAKTVTSQVGDIELAVPRDRAGTFTPMLVGKGQRRPLESLYPVIYLDAIMVKVKDGSHVVNKAARIAIGVDMDGIRHVLGIWVQNHEGAKFWSQVCSDLANRDVRDILISCCDRLIAFP